MVYVISEPCIDVLDKTCVEQCPVDCIYEGERMMFIHPDECIDCGACELTCPVEAIRHEAALPEEWRPFAEASRAFFATLGSPRGASSVGKTSNDPEWIKARPRRTSREGGPPDA